MVKNLLIMVVMLFSALVQAAGALAIDENQGDQYGFAYDYASVLQYCASYGGSQCIVRSWGCNSN